MTRTNDPATKGLFAGSERVPLIIASILRSEGTTGVSTHVRELCSYLDEQCYPYKVVTPFSWGQPLSTAIFGLRLPLEWVDPPASVLWYRHWHTVFLAKALRRHLANFDSAVIYAQGPEAALASLHARVTPHQSVVMAVHFLRSQADGWVTKGHIPANGHAARTIEQSERTVLEGLDGIVYVSRVAKDRLLASYPAAAAIPSQVVPNFVRTLPPNESSKPVADLVTIGGLEIEKNQQFILQVLALAKRAGKNYTLDIYGVGPLRASLERTANRLGLASQVRFRGFDRHVRDSLPLYRAYLHACPVETGPLALIEAMAAGLPVLAGASGGVSELISDGVEGRYWPLDDPPHSAQILIALLEDENARLAAGRAASLRYQSGFTAELVVPELLDFFQYVQTKCTQTKPSAETFLTAHPRDRRTG